MESFSGDTEESTEDIPGRKKSRFKSLKTRLFGKSKRAGEEENTKLTHSASDITAEKDLGSEEDLSCSQGTMGSRALSHDSIFLADQVLTDAEPDRVLSQENVHSKIKALQMKLQLQNLHLGPQSMGPPTRRPEDVESHSEDDSLPCSPTEVSGGDVAIQGTLIKARPLSPVPKPAPTKPLPLIPSHPVPRSLSSNPSVVEPPLDFGSPAQFTPCLDTSAARHRLSVKPKNQRASSKRRHTTTDSKPLVDVLNNIDHYESGKEEEQQLSTQEEVALETEQVEAAVPPIASQHLPSKSPEVEPITPEAASKSSSQTIPQQDQALSGRVPSVLRVKPHRPADVVSSERPHSSYIPSELKDKREEGFEIQVMTHDKRKTAAAMTEVSSDQLSSGFGSGVHQQVQGETENTRGIRRPTPGSGSFHSSIITAKNQDGERPRSGSVVGVLEQTEARQTMENKPFASFREKPEPGGPPSAVGRLRQDGALPKSTQKQHSTEEEVALETEQVEAVVPIASQHLPSKSPEVEPITPEAASKSSSQTIPQQDQALPGRVPSVLRVKPHRPADVVSSERPHSSYIPSELKDKRDEAFQIQVMTHDKRKTSAVMTEVSSDQLSQQVQGENTREIRRPTPGSGSFHSSITTAKNQDRERPRSGSFEEVLKQTEARQTMENKPFESFREKPEPRGPPFALGRLRQDGALPKSSGLPWDRRDSLTKVESVTASKNITTDPAVVKEVESRSHEVEEAAEAQEVEEDDGKRAFGIKLRSTSHSMKFRPDASSNLNSKPPASKEPCDKQKRQETRDNANNISKKLSTNIFGTTSTIGDLRQSDPAPSSFTLPVKHNPPSTCVPPVMPAEPQTTSTNPKEDEASLTAPQEPKPAPQSIPPEVSWMSLAMEKTRSLQQLLTRRLPRDLTGVQTVIRPQAQVQTTNQAETVTVKCTTSVEAANQASIDVVKAEVAQSRSQAPTVKPSLIAVQQKTSTASPVQSNTSREPQTSKQTNELQSHPNTPQSVSQSASMQTNRWTTQPPLQSSVQTEASPQFAQGSVQQSLAQSYLSSGQQQPPWSNRGVPPANQLKPTTSAPTSVSTTSSARAPVPPVSALAKGEREPSVVQEKDGASLPGRRTVWAGSVSGKAAFSEKREWTTPPGNKGVEVKKARTEAQTSGESAATAKTTPLSKDTQPEGRPGVKPAESGPTKIPDRSREDKWPRKNVPSSSLPSSSPTMPSALQSMSDSSQPSWMELAKRKSMAWSDKSMD